MTSIDKRRNGKYRVRWREHANGPQLTKTFGSSAAAKAYRIKIEQELVSGTYVPADIAATTWSDFVKVFLSRQVWRQSTREVGERALRRASEQWSDRPLPTIHTSDVQSYVKASTLAPSTLRTELQHIGAVFAMAVNDGLLVRSPMKGVRRPKVAAPLPAWLPREEVEALIDAAPSWFRIAVELGRTLGIRQSELRGLTVDRVRHLQREIVIDRQANRHRLGWSPTKNSVVRTIPTDVGVIEMIEEHRAMHGVGPEGLLLHRDGVFVNASMFDRAWRATRVGAGLRSTVRYHDLRHTIASELLSAGLSATAVAAVLGDEPGTVLKTYGHVTTTDHDRVRTIVRSLRSPAAEDSVRTATGSHPF